MFGLDVLTGGGGFSGSSSANSSAGPATLGGFYFAPKGGNTIPPIAWIALAAVAAALILRKK